MDGLASESAVEVVRIAIAIIGVRRVQLHGHLRALWTIVG